MVREAMNYVEYLFQFTPLREGRRLLLAVHQQHARFQFTPLREGRPAACSCVLFLLFISIHAPPRGATVGIRQQRVTVGISIHAPPRGATRPSRYSRPERIFQFTPLREGRQLMAFQTIVKRLFQFTPLREGRPWRVMSHSSASNFNSRPSARGDGKRYAISANLLFNPYKSAWLNNSATQFVEIILVIFHRIIA